MVTSQAIIKFNLGLQVMMVTEYMQAGDLGTALANDNAANRRLGWYNNGSQIALDIARGLAYLHHRKVLKPCMGLQKHAQSVASLGQWCEQGSCYHPLPTTSGATFMQSAATAAGLPSRRPSACPITTLKLWPCVCR